MELKGIKIADFLHNYVCYRLTDDGFIHPLRYTEKQVAHLTAFSEKQATRALASANITVELITDSNLLGLDLRFIPGSSRMFGAVDLVIDDRLTDTFEFEQPEAYNISFRLPEGRKKVTVYFPWSMQTEISSITVDDNCYMERTNKTRTVICIGDSITQGYIADNPSLSYVGRLTSHLDAEVINQGNGGYFLDADELDDSIEVKPDLVSFAYGTNDYSRNSDISVIRRNLEAFIRKLTSVFPGTPILCITPPYRGSEKHFNRVKELGWGYETLVPMFHEVCSGFNCVTVIDDTVPHGPENFAPDYTHPTPLGFEHYFNNIFPTVKKLMGL